MPPGAIGHDLDWLATQRDRADEREAARCGIDAIARHLLAITAGDVEESPARIEDHGVRAAFHPHRLLPRPPCRSPSPS